MPENLTYVCAAGSLGRSTGSLGLLSACSATDPELLARMPAEVQEALLRVQTRKREARRNGLEVGLGASADVTAPKHLRQVLLSPCCLRLLAFKPPRLTSPCAWRNVHHRRSVVKSAYEISGTAD